MANLEQINSQLGQTVNIVDRLMNEVNKASSATDKLTKLTEIFNTLNREVDKLSSRKAGTGTLLNDQDVKSVKQNVSEMQSSYGKLWRAAQTSAPKLDVSEFEKAAKSVAKTLDTLNIPTSVKINPANNKLELLKNTTKGISKELEVFINTFSKLNKADLLSVDLNKSGELFSLVSILEQIKSEADSLSVELESDDAINNLNKIESKVRAVDKVLNSYREDMNLANVRSVDMTRSQLNAAYTDDAKDVPTTLKGKLNKSRRAFLGRGKSDESEDTKLLDRLRSEIDSDEVYNTIKGPLDAYNTLQEHLRQLTRYGKNRSDYELAHGFNITAEKDIIPLLNSYARKGADTYNEKYDPNIRENTLIDFAQMIGKELPQKKILSGDKLVDNPEYIKALNDAEKEYDKIRKADTESYKEEIKRLEKTKAELKKSKAGKSAKEQTDINNNIKIIDTQIKDLNKELVESSKSLHQKEQDIERNIQNLKSSGTHIKGYNELFKEASDLEKPLEQASKFYRDYNEIKNGTLNSDIEIPKNATIADLKNVAKQIVSKTGLGQDEGLFDYRSESEDSLYTKEELEAEAKRLRDITKEQIKATQEEVQAEIQKKQAVEQSTQNINEEIKTNNAVVAAKVNYVEKLQNEIKNSGLSEDDIKSKLKPDSEYLARYSKLGERVKGTLSGILKDATNINPETEEEIGDYSPLDRHAALNKYKTELSTSANQIKANKEALTQFFALAGTGNFTEASNMKLPLGDIEKIRSLLDSGLRKNVENGIGIDSTNYADLKDFMNWIIKSSSELKIDAFSDEEAIQAEKLKDTVKIIADEKERIKRIDNTRNNSEKIQEAYIKDKKAEMDRQYSEKYYTQMRANYEKGSKEYKELSKAIGNQASWGKSGNNAESLLKEAGIALPSFEYTPKLLPGGNGLDQSSATAINGVIEKFNNKLEAEKNKLSSTIQKLNAEFGKLSASGVNKETDEYKQLAAGIENVTRKANELNSTQSLGLSAYQNLTTETQNWVQRSKEAYNTYLAEAKSKFNEIKQYTKDYEVLNGKPMTNAEQAEYYKNQLPQFAERTREWMEVKRLQMEAERRAADDIARSAQREKEAYQQVLATINNISSAISSVVRGISGSFKAAISVVRTFVNFVRNSFNALKSTIDRILSLFGNFGNRLRELFNGATHTANGFNILKGSATELRSKIQLLTGAFNQLFNNKFIKQGESLLSSVYSLRSITDSNVTQEMINWANSMEYAFGLSAEGLIADSKELNGVLYGLGVQKEHIAGASQNLLMMGKYLASIGMAGGDADQVMSKITSGMKGMTASIDDLGLSVREAEMDSFLKELKAQGGEYTNIGTSFASLNEEARVYVRLASLMDQFYSKHDITSMATSMDTVTGKIMLFKEAITSLVSTIGVGFTNLASKIAGYITPLIYTIESLFVKFFSFLGVSTEVSTTMNDLTKHTDSMASGIGGVSEELDKVSESAADAGTNLQSFDKLNNITSSSGSGSGAAGDFDYSSLFENKLGELNKLAEEAEKSYLEKQRELLKEQRKKAYEQFITDAKKITGRDDFDIGLNIEKITADWESIQANIVSIWEQISALFKKYGLMLMDDLNIGEIFTNFVGLLAGITNYIDTFLSKCEPGLLLFYNEVIKPIAEGISELVNEKLTGWTSTLNEKAAGLTESGIEEWFKNLADIFNTSVIPVFENLADLIGNVWEVMSPLLSELGEWTLSDGLPWLADTIEKISNYVSEHGEEIRETFKDLASLVWDSFKLFADAFGKVITIAIENPDAIKAVAALIIGGKVAAPLVAGVDGAVKSATGVGILGLLLKKLGIVGATGAAGGTAAAAGTATTGVAGGIGAVLSGAGTKIGVALSGIGTKAVATLSGIGTKVASSIGAVLSGISLPTVATAGGILAGVLGIGSGIKDMWNGYKDGDAFTNRSKDDLAAAGALKVTSVAGGAILGGTIGSVVPVVGTGLGAAVGAGIGGIAGLLGIDENTGAFVNDLIYGKGKTAEEWWSGVKEDFNGINNSLNEWANNTGTDISNAFTEAKNNVSNTWEEVTLFFDGVWIDIQGVFSDVDDWFSEKFNLAKESIHIAWNDTKEYFSGIWTDIQNVFSDIDNWFSEEFENAKADAYNALKGLGSDCKTIANDIYKSFSEIKDKLSEVWKNIKTEASEKLGEIWHGITNFASDIGKDIYDFFTGANTKLATKSKTVSMPIFAGNRASGGTVRSGQLFMARENGLTELVGDFGGYTGVANNSMITKAMYDAVYAAVSSAMGSGSGNKIVNVSIPDRPIFHRREVIALVNELVPYINSNKYNVANTGFGI